MFFLIQQFPDNITEAWNEKFNAIDEIIESDNHVDSDEKRDLIAELQFENSSLVTAIFFVKTYDNVFNWTVHILFNPTFGRGSKWTQNI